jgi:tripartite-type tricarboxylate transporter receptor subunit TctC
MRLSVVLSLIFLAASALPSAAQQYPSKPITMIVPYAPGGNVDVSTRVLQAAIGDALGQPIVIEHRPGGAGLIAGDYVARAAPDGHTLLVGSNGPVILGPLTMAKPAYQWEQAFAPVSSLATATNMLLVRQSLPVQSVAELVDYARKNPNKLTLATSSVASINHFLGELFKLKAGITWTEVHYRGNAIAITDLLAGHVDVGFQQLVDAAQHLQSGKLRALAVPPPRPAKDADLSASVSRSPARLHLPNVERYASADCDLSLPAGTATQHVAAPWGIASLQARPMPWSPVPDGFHCEGRRNSVDLLGLLTRVRHSPPQTVARPVFGSYPGIT